MGSPPRQSGQQSEQTDWLVPVCRGPLGPVLLIGADRPARLEMLPPCRPAGPQSWSVPGLTSKLRLGVGPAL